MSQDPTNPRIFLESCFFRWYGGLMRFLSWLIPLVACTSNLPHLVSVKAGAFDFHREKHRTFELGMEVLFHFDWLSAPFKFLEFRPMLGVMATAKGSGFLYGGIQFDLLFFDHLLIAPGFAPGYYWQGSGKNLGYPLEFRSSIELGWQFTSRHRLGVQLYHLSNASIGRRNPGEESLILFYDIPITKKFPF
jgi:lipid A 3-O-deacylase